MKKIGVFLLTFLLPTVLFLKAYAQQPIAVKFTVQAFSDIKLAPVQLPTTFVKSASEANQLITKNLLLLNEKGYLAAVVDSQKWWSENQLEAYITVGNAYNWAVLKIKPEDENWIRAAGINKVPQARQAISPKGFVQFKEQLISYAENNGYPFFQVRLDSIFIRTNEIQANLILQKNELIRLDSIVQKGKRVVTNRYLYRYLGLKPNMLYDESSIKNVAGLIKSLTFTRSANPPNVLFLQGHSLLYLYLQPKPANRFNFLLGVLPSTSNLPNTKSSFLISGEGDMHLENMQSTANELNVNFKLYPQQTKQLMVDYLHPYLFNIPFGTDVALAINKFDSTFLEVSYQIGIRQFFKGNDFVRLYFKNTSSQVLLTDTALIKTTHRLPAQIDASNQLAGIEFRKRKLDYLFNPTKGYQIQCNLVGGIRQLFPNASIINLKDDNNPSFQFASLYDSIPLKKMMGQITTQASFYQLIGKRTVIKLAWRASKKAGVVFFNNEVERIGGFKTIRGFDELSIATTAYSLQTLECRYLLGLNSFAYLFTDYAYTELFTYQQHTTNHPYGFGAGVAFETKAGIFQLNYAYGASDQTAIQWKSAKIHFGYLVQF
jgi:hypothetical protein